MKLKINKACDINSISVLPPHSRRSMAVHGGGPGTSVLGGVGGGPTVAASQIRSQPSQQSFSQGISSQHGIFSQLSQNSLNDVITNDQRFCSQERDNSAKKIPFPPPVAYGREESQVPVSLSSSNFMRKWNSASVSDRKCQISEELDNRISTMETSLGRFGIMLDSVQSDLMQINKGIKGISLELEAIRQKVMVHEDSIHILNRGQEDIRTSLDAGFKSIMEQLSKNAHEDKLQETLSAVLAFPRQMESFMQKQKNEICRFFSSELQALISNLKSLNNNNLPSAVLPPKVNPKCSSPMPLMRSSPLPIKVIPEASLVSKIETGNWTLMKTEQANLLNRSVCKDQKQRKLSSMQQDRGWRGFIDLDEDLDGVFSCFIVEKETENDLMDEAKKETERILRRARRKRKQCTTTVIN